MNVTLPDWLAGRLLDQGSGAYESLEPSLRAYLKTQIAILHEEWLPVSREKGVLQRAPDGPVLLEERLAHDWAVFILAEDYASPAGFVAAVLPALMAEVGSLVILRLGPAQNSLHPSISAALELLGREEIFYASQEEGEALVKELKAQSRFGRVVTLGHNSPACAYKLPGAIKIGLDGAEVDKNILYWLHPGVELEAFNPAADYDAVISAAPAFMRQYPAPLVLGPAYEYFWQWPDLTPAFFQRRGVFITRNTR